MDKGERQLTRRKKRRAPRRAIAGTVRRHSAGIVVFLSMVIGLLLIGIVKDNLALEEQSVTLGVTFSKKYAVQLGLPWKQVYTDILEELQVKRLRIPVYWDDVEPEPGVFDFRDVDWQVREAGRHGAVVVLAIGMKVPRWPECHPPGWARGLEGVALQERVITLLETTVRHYARESTIVVWQVENEPLFDFGLCPPPDAGFLKREVAAVRAIDDRPIMITESGELSTWVRAAAVADILGVSTYRSVWNRYVGYFFWPVTPNYYAKRAQALTQFVDRIVVSELQAEPWGPGPTEGLTIEEQFRSMNPSRLAENVSFVRRIGFPEAYLWGVEWWYWLKERGNPEMWEAGIRVFGGKPIMEK